MVRNNQITVRTDEDYFACIPCNERTFSSEEKLHQHCRTAKVHRGEWCDVHKWLFVTEGALSAHLHDASDHWVCSICDTDEDTEEDLVEHPGSKHSRCYHCSMNVGHFHRHRVDDHNRCDECSEEFSDQNEVRMVGEVTIKFSVRR